MRPNVGHRMRDHVGRAGMDTSDVRPVCGGGIVTILRVVNLLLSLAMACALLVCGALLLALSPWAPGLRWAAGVCMFVGMWEGR